MCQDFQVQSVRHVYVYLEKGIVKLTYIVTFNSVTSFFLGLLLVLMHVVSSYIQSLSFSQIITECHVWYPYPCQFFVAEDYVYLAKRLW